MTNYSLRNCCIALLILQSVTAATQLDASSTVLLTGATSLLGRQLALALHQVYQVSNLVLVDDHLEEGFLTLAPQIPHADCYRVDLRPHLFSTQQPSTDSSTTSTLDYLLETKAVTHVVHLDDEPPLSTERATVLEGLVEALQRRPHIALVYASTSSVYDGIGSTDEETPLPPSPALVQELVAHQLEHSILLRLWPLTTTTHSNDSLLHVDDAVDAILAALQVRGHAVLNIGGPSTERARQVLGWEPQAEHALTDSLETSFQPRQQSNEPQSQPLDCHSLYDTDCSGDTPLFPCASHCGAGRCVPTVWDDIATYTQTLTAHCKTVLYTIGTPVHVKVSPQSHGHVPDRRCNVAFVAQTSLQVGSLWTAVQVAATEEWALLPKIAPQAFFPSAQTMIYTAPHVVLDHLPQSSHSDALVTLAQRPDKTVVWSETASYQNRAYRMWRLDHDWPAPMILDTSVVIQGPESSTLQCRVLWDVHQWEDDAMAWEFWMRWYDLENSSAVDHRRLAEEFGGEQEEEEPKGDDDGDGDDASEEVVPVQTTTDEAPLLVDEEEWSDDGMIHGSTEATLQEVWLSVSARTDTRSDLRAHVVPWDSLRAYEVRSEALPASQG